MKTSVPMQVNYLRIYPVAKERTSKVSGTKSMKVASMIFIDSLPRSAGQSENNAIEFTAKQLDNLCSIARIRGTGSDTWYNLAELVGTMESVAVVSAQSHDKGDKYIAEGGEEKEYLETSTSCQVDSIVLPVSVRETMRAETIKKVINWTDKKDSLVNKLLGEQSKVVVPDGVQ